MGPEEKKDAQQKGERDLLSVSQLIAVAHKTQSKCEHTIPEQMHTTRDTSSATHHRTSNFKVQIPPLKPAHTKISPAPHTLSFPKISPALHT